MATLYPSLHGINSGTPGSTSSVGGPGAHLQGQYPVTPTPIGGFPRNTSQQQLYNTPARSITTNTPGANTISGQSLLFQPKSPEARITATTPTSATTPGKAVEINSKAAAPLTPIHYAKNAVNEYLDKDIRYPDLDRIIQQSQLSEYFFTPTPGASAWVPFERSKTVNIPDIIFEQYNKTECYTRMGLFPQIKRAWITVDNRLYFWNYSNGNDYSSFEELQHTILSVNLIKPHKGTFVDSIKYLLVLATPLELHLIAVSYENNELNLFETGMEVSIKGLDVNVITGSDATGRIFFTSRESTDVWEFTYSNTESWFKGKCGKVCHTRSGFSGFTPSIGSLSPITNILPTGIVNAFLPGSHHEYIVQIVIDDSRSTLYTLSSRSTIRTYYLNSPTELKTNITYPVNHLLSHLQMLNAPSPLLDPRTTSIVSIHAVSPRESAQIHLIATTSTGCRIYIRAARSSYVFTTSGEGGPSTMQAIQIRFPPPDGTGPTGSTSSVLKKTKFSKLFAPGYYFAVKEGNESDDLFVSAPDSGRILLQSSTSNTAPQQFEMASFVDIEGFVQAIELITPELQITNKPEGFGNEVAGQFIIPPTQVAVLTNTGVHIYKRRYAPEIFMQLGNEARYFYDLYGRSETCATALYVASSSSSSSPLDAREIAKKAYLEFGGKSHIRDDNYISDALSLDNVKLSGRFDGLATYIARIVRDIWRVPIFKIVGKGKSRAYVSNVLETTLNKYQIMLFELYEFLETNRHLIDGLSGPDRAFNNGIGGGRGDELSLQAEHRGMHALVQLITFMREGISFIGLVAGESKKLKEIMSLLPAEVQGRLLKLTYQELFTASEGTELAKELVSAIVNQSIAAGGSVDNVAEVLRQRCGSFCSADDVVLFKAIEYLRKAKLVASTDPDLKLQYSRESVRLLDKAASTISFEDLNDAVHELLVLEFHPGVVETVLRAAAEADRGNQALAFFADGRPELDPREELYQKRFRCYELVFAILDDADKRANGDNEQRETDDQQDQQGNNATNGQVSLQPISELQTETYAAAYASKDELFHYCFYDWFVSRGLAQRLLEIDTPYIESYLENNARTNLQQADLLWVFEAKKEQYLQAGQVLYRLAQSDFNLTLAQRIEYLSRARGFCNCYCPPAQRQIMLRLHQSIEDEFAVAFIQDDLLSHVKADDRLSGDGEADKRAGLIDKLDGKVLNLSVLYNEFANPLGYRDIQQAIIKAADYNG
ncbi:Nup133 N terminal like-domain-containing protein [Lipomyces japonicus]|uniref:Nup133 N terminal like-domain-containing protein n=1 Tax=Lipomyces japonicus TaxID=56871 RepID=UPI0034CFE7C9